MNAMRTLNRNSLIRLRNITNTNTNCIHRRFNLDTILISPFMVLPHYAEMANYLVQFNKTYESKLAAALTTAAKSLVESQRQFMESLFLFLQEATRASTLSPLTL
jgi:hypothetical protein